MAPGLALLNRVHARRVAHGFCDDISTTRKIVELGLERPGLSRSEFFRFALSGTLEITQDPKAHRLEESRHYSLDVMVHDYFKRDGAIRFLDAGCGFSSGFAPTTTDTVAIFSRLGSPIKATALDTIVPEEMNGKTKVGILYLKADLFGSESSRLGKFDYIRCMHLLYYFSQKVAGEAVEKLIDLLAPGGVLAEDSLTTKRQTVVRLHQKGNGVVFQGDPYAEN